MAFTDKQMASFKDDWEHIAIDNNIEIRQYDNGDVCAFGSEIATLRLFASYNFNGDKSSKFARCGYSKNLDKFWFELRISEMYKS